MSWMRKLYDTYEYCYGNENSKRFPDISDLLPIGHIFQNVNIKVILNADGKFIGAELLENMSLIIPATEKSAGRSGKNPAPHPLVDKIRYCSEDYISPFGGRKKSFFKEYEQQLGLWANSKKYSHPKIRAVYAYVLKKQLVRDLSNEKLLELDDYGRLCQKPRLATEPGIFKYLAGEKDQGDAFICWSVEGLGIHADVCNDPELQRNWIAYYEEQKSEEKMCMLTGHDALVAEQHPRGIRRSGDGAKLISANDEKGFTFRGKFDSSNEASTVGYEATQKAHSALRWLIGRQGSRQGDQVVLAWVVAGQSIPSPVEDDWVLKIPEQPFVPEVAEHGEPTLSHAANIGQSFSQELKKALAGYSAKFQPTDEILILGLDAATPGRLSVIFYREKSVEEYLDALRAWQEDCGWLLRKKGMHQENGKERERIFWRHSAPIPREITLAAYGQNADDKLAAATRECLLPCIADSTPLPLDLVYCAVRRAARRSGLDAWEWEHTLGVACALYRGYYARHPKSAERRKYEMALEPERTSRDYLFGRLLAVAERIENAALYIAKEKRPTNAERLMQRFADRPLSTWKTLEEAVQPYRQRLVQTKGGFLTIMDKLLDEILSLFDADDFTDRPLSGEYLLGYHCQRQALWNKSTDKNEDANENTEGEE